VKVCVGFAYLIIYKSFLFINRTYKKSLNSERDKTLGFVIIKFVQ